MDLFYCIAKIDGIKYALYSHEPTGDDCWKITRPDYLVYITALTQEFPSLMEPSMVH